MPTPIIVSGGFDDIKSRDLRFLEEAAKLGALSVLLWPDAAISRLTGKAPKFPLAERLYFLNENLVYLYFLCHLCTILDIEILPIQYFID